CPAGGGTGCAVYCAGYAGAGDRGRLRAVDCRGVGIQLVLVVAQAERSFNSLPTIEREHPIFSEICLCVRPFARRSTASRPRSARHWAWYACCSFCSLLRSSRQTLVSWHSRSLSLPGRKAR